MQRAVVPVMLAVVVAVGGWLRLHDLGTPGLWLDEILAVVRGDTLASVWNGVTDPQHGPLFHFSLVLSGWVSPSEASYRLPFAVAGVAGLWAMFELGRLVGGPWVGLLAAALLAFSPLHVLHSREARPYAFQVLELLVGLIAALRSAPHTTTVRFGAPGTPVPPTAPSRRWLIVWAAMLVLLTATSAQGLWYSAILLGAFLVLHVPRVPRAVLVTFVTAALVSGAVFTLFFAALVIKSPDIIGPPPITFDFVAQLGQVVVSGHNEIEPWRPVLWWILAVAAVGAAVVARESMRLAVILAGIAILGILLPIIALHVTPHGIRARLTFAAMPGLFVLAACAFVFAAHAVARLTRVPERGVLALLSAAAICGIVVWQRPEIARALASKADWRYVAALIKERARPGDLVVASNSWSELCLQYYLPRVGAQLDLRSAEESVEKARGWLDASKPAFLVAAGYHADPSIRRWMDAFPVLFAADTEVTRVYFHPNRLAYLLTRAPDEERVRYERILWHDLSGQLLIAENALPFMLDGWSPLEQHGNSRVFRWAEGRQSRLYVPVIERRPTRLQLDVMPFPPLQSQSITVLVDGKQIAVLDLPRGYSFHDVDLSAAEFRPGSHIFELQFAASARPADTMPDSTDGRSLAAVFRSVRLR